MNRFAIGRRIEAYRDKLSMSTQELAERIQRSQATISRIENGKQGLTFELLSRIASELRIHPFSLLSDDPVRHSVLLPPPDRKRDGYTPNLLANALHGGRVKRELRIEAAAGLLGLSASELESFELALDCPGDAILGKMCELYGLDAGHMRLLKGFAEAAPDMARGLAYLQQLFSHIRRLVRNIGPGEEGQALDRISRLLDSTDSDYPLPPDSSGDDIGLFLNRLSLHLVSALKDREFRGKIMTLARHEENEELRMQERYAAEEPHTGMEMVER